MVQNIPKDIHLDGRTLEGGGQLVRLALSLSSLTGRPVQFSNIRGNRDRGKGSKGGGLKQSHLECVKWLARMVNAHTEGVELGSTELVFRPNQEQAAQAVIKPTREVTITQKTPGSIYLIVQALLPYILFGTSGPSPVRLTITGGTNVPSSPSHDYATKVLFPTLAEHLGIPPITAVLKQRGWSTANTTTMGEVSFVINPIKATLPEFKLIERGNLAKFDVSIIAHPPTLLRDIVSTLVSSLAKKWPEAETELTLTEDSQKHDRAYVLVVAEFMFEGRCSRLGRDCLYDGRGRIKDLAKHISKRLVTDLEREIAHEGPVDEHLQDQLVVFQALASGRSKVWRGLTEASLHSQTARWVAEEMLPGLHFNGTGCNGIGLVSSQQDVAMKDVIQAVGKLSLNEEN